MTGERHVASVASQPSCSPSGFTALEVAVSGTPRITTKIANAPADARSQFS
jgi:hypothetical protein